MSNLKPHRWALGVTHGEHPSAVLTKKQFRVPAVEDSEAFHRFRVP